ncbi:MAG: exosortase/archaeosortase family protein [Paludibacteraceae bacterium]|nr:exosortase/archaeosortase family protein [Paludibacteraceae bacterium]
MKFHSLKRQFEPYIDIIIFMVTLLVANYFWKFTMKGDEYGDLVTWFGLDVTAPFEFMSCHIAAAVYWLVGLFRDTVYMVGEHTIRFDSGSGTTIIWGCSGLKQMFIWMCLILTVRSGKAKPAYVTWLHKLWFIPVGWICCHAFNILRIFLISLFIEFHPGWFPILHDYIFKYAFYAMLFGLWVLFVEKIRPNASQR